MAEINEDFLNDEIDFELLEDTELDEEALLEDADEEIIIPKRDKITEKVDASNEVENEIEAEDRFNETLEEAKVHTLELEDGYKSERKDKFSTERKIITSPEADNSENYIKKKPFQRNSFRGTSRGRGRAGYANVLHRNKTVLINPNFQGIVHVNNTNARLPPHPWATGPLGPQPPMQVQPSVAQPQMNMQLSHRQPSVMQMHISTPNSYQQMGPPPVYQPQQQQPQQNFAYSPQQQVQMSYWDGQSQVSYPTCDQFQYQGNQQQPYNMHFERQVFTQPPPPHNVQPAFNSAQPPPQVHQNQPIYENQQVRNSHPNQFQNYNNQFQSSNNFQNQGGFSNNTNNYQRPPQLHPQQQYVKRKTQTFVPRKKFFVNNTGRNDLTQNRLVRENRLALNGKVNKSPERQPVITQVKVEDPDEDDDTKKLRLQIELQKKRREEILRWKEERRKQLLQGKQHETVATPTVVVTQNVVQFKKPQPVYKNVLQKNLTTTQNKQNFIHPKLQPRQRSPNIVVTTGFSKKPSRYQKIAQKTVTVGPGVANTNNRLVTVTNTVANANIGLGGGNTKDHISSFLTDRKVLVKDESLMNTRTVMIKNLSTSTTDKRILTICKTIGDVQKLQRNKLKQQASIVFKSVASAHAFYKKYQRHMIDLSMIEVVLVPKLEPPE